MDLPITVTDVDTEVCDKADDKSNDGSFSGSETSFRNSPVGGGILKRKPSEKKLTRKASFADDNFKPLEIIHPIPTRR